VPRRIYRVRPGTFDGSVPLDSGRPVALDALDGVVAVGDVVVELGTVRRARGGGDPGAAGDAGEQGQRGDQEDGSFGEWTFGSHCCVEGTDGHVDGPVRHGHDSRGTRLTGMVTARAINATIEHTNGSFRGRPLALARFRHARRYQFLPVPIRLFRPSSEGLRAQFHSG